MARQRKKLSMSRLEKANRYKRPTKEEDVDVQETIRKQQRAIERRNDRAYQQAQNAIGYNGGDGRSRRSGGIRSIFYDPLMMDTNRYGRVQTISPYYGRQISYRILRSVSQKAFASST
jgi:hypothetical protein